MWRVFAIAVVGVVCLVPRVAAQSTFGSIVGVVDDPSNAPVAGASEVLTTLAFTQQIRTKMELMSS
jgi:hypothetical protein